MGAGIWKVLRTLVSDKKPCLDSSQTFGRQNKVLSVPMSCCFSGSNGKYWAAAGDGSINADSSEPRPFQFELCGQSRFFVKADNGQYIKGEQNGIFSATVDLSKATKWEY